jgi:hypothetical protein
MTLPEAARQGEWERQRANARDPTRPIAAQASGIRHRSLGFEDRRLMGVCNLGARAS